MLHSEPGLGFYYGKAIFARAVGTIGNTPEFILHFIISISYLY